MNKYPAAILVHCCLCTFFEYAGIKLVCLRDALETVKKISNQYACPQKD